ncbi:Hypothetical predicted protein [Paramuricea clavata]|uniref:Uncharacterized protein n=1 Tax=Paramuricea clavata TaxID=317549 RepID=A0A6S7JKG2_PARCT|nr:Hypothetical predicted protein [Paramuricea clavata]
MSSRRALHFVFKIGNRRANTKFYRDLLGLKVLRHEEFEEGCKASCNGPYDGKWSKTMAGYGPEDDHFVVELTYNYGIKEYKLGNDFQGVTVSSSEAIKRFKNDNSSVLQDLGNGKYKTQSPDGYIFYLVEKDKQQDPVEKVSLGVSDLSKSVKYWHELLGMKLYEQNSNTALLGYGDEQCKLELVSLAQSVDHATAFGRIAFSCPRDQLPEIEAKVKEAGHTIITPLVRLDTPGKAAVEVVILADVDGHEICFVGDEAFRELSQIDPKAKDLLDEAMEQDKSDEWFAKKKKK